MYRKVCQTIALDNNACLKIARNPTRMHSLNDLHLYWYFIRNVSANSLESDLILIGIGNSKAKSAESEFECLVLQERYKFFLIRITGRGVAFAYSSRVSIDLTRFLFDGKRIKNPSDYSLAKKDHQVLSSS